MGVSQTGVTKKRYKIIGLREVNSSDLEAGSLPHQHNPNLLPLGSGFDLLFIGMAIILFQLRLFPTLE